MPEHDAIARRQFAAAPGRRRHGLFIAGILALIGVAALAAGPLVADGGLVTVVMFTMAAIQAGLTLYRTRDTGPVLVFDAAGIRFRDWNLPVVPWRHVGAVYQAGIRLQPFVCIDLVDAAAFLDTLDGIARSRLRSNRLVRPPRLFIPTNAVDATPAEVESALVECRSQALRDRSRTGDKD